MINVLKKLVLILSIIVLGGCMNRPTQEEMNAELRKPEVVTAIEEAIRNADKDAFTETGIIKSYEIDYTKTYHNPMGGIEIMLYINEQKNLYLKYTINKREGIYSVGGSATSGDLVDLLRRK